MFSPKESNANMIIAASLISIFALFIGAMAGAWRRACVRAAKDFLIVRQMHGFERSRLNQSIIQFVTPKWVGSRHSLALLLFLVAAVLAAIGLSWYWGIAWFFGLVILCEIVAFIFPGPGSHYYSQQICEDATLRRNAAHMGRDDETLAALDMLIEATQIGE